MDPVNTATNRIKKRKRNALHRPDAIGAKRTCRSFFWNVVFRTTRQGILPDHLSPTKVLTELCQRLKFTRLSVPPDLTPAQANNALILLRGFQKLQFLVARKKYNLTNKACVICHQPLFVPIFRYHTQSEQGTVGYHVSCVDEWLQTSFVLQDLTTQRAYSLSSLQHLDYLCEAYGTRCRDCPRRSLASLKTNQNLDVVRKLLKERAQEVDLISQQLTTYQERLQLVQPLFAFEQMMIQPMFKNLAGLDRQVACQHLKTLMALPVIGRIESLCRLFSFIDCHLDQWAREGAKQHQNNIDNILHGAVHDDAIRIGRPSNVILSFVDNIIYGLEDSDDDDDDEEQGSTEEMDRSLVDDDQVEMVQFMANNLLRFFSPFGANIQSPPVTSNIMMRLLSSQQNPEQNQMSRSVPPIATTTTQRPLPSQPTYVQAQFRSDPELTRTTRRMPNSNINPRNSRIVHPGVARTRRRIPIQIRRRRRTRNQQSLYNRAYIPIAMRTRQRINARREALPR